VSVMHDLLALVLSVTTWPLLAYFVVANSSYLLLVALAAVAFARYLRRLPFAGFEETYASPLTTPVSVLVPAYNEAAGIVASTTALLALRYPQHEVVVVDDGSTDGTFAALVEAYGLVEVPRELRQEIPTRGRVLSVHLPRDGRTRLVVVRTENSGRSDSLNVAINAARHELVCFVDADSILDPDALLTVAKPFADDPLRMVATGGVIRAANGCRVVAGRVVEARMPTGWLARVQVVEYLRTFLLGRTGWSHLGCLVLISGAFGLFRRDVVVEVGGLDPDCIGEDFELCVKVHRALRDRGQDYRMVFVAEPVAWTEVPSTRRVLASQRRRWHRGLWEVLWRHRRMIGNPRYGRVGLVALPYYVVFELLAPVIELCGLVISPLGYLFGLVDATYCLTLLVLTYAYAILISLAAVAVEEFSFHRYGRWRDLGVAMAVTVLENFGYRQLTAWWRVQGLWAALRGTEQVWGVMTREGFAEEPIVLPALPTQRSADSSPTTADRL
jgi:cellulose synthase/poly-beta-1,6-N-acetylglucosamine synthase-like glycosyltransferase